MPKILLGVNIDHIATLRQARKGVEPDPLEAALIAEASGADLITLHLREDRRHIQDKDVYAIKKRIRIPMNLEMAPIKEIADIAIKVRPYKVTIVPEKREEITTEGGLDVIKNNDILRKVITRLKEADIIVSLFVEPDISQIKESKNCGADCIEIHTGKYANNQNKKAELFLIIKSVKYAKSIGLQVHAGHGLNTENAVDIAAIEGIDELNIGHSIISQAVLYGLPKAIHTIKEKML